MKRKALFRVGDAVQERSERLPYMTERWISAVRYDKAQKCWMYKVRKDRMEEDLRTGDPGWVREHSLKRP